MRQARTRLTKLVQAFDRHGLTYITKAKFCESNLSTLAEPVSDRRLRLACWGLWYAHISEKLLLIMVQIDTFTTMPWRSKVPGPFWLEKDTKIPRSQTMFKSATLIEIDEETSTRALSRNLKDCCAICKYFKRKVQTNTKQKERQNKNFYIIHDKHFQHQHLHYQTKSSRRTNVFELRTNSIAGTSWSRKHEFTMQNHTYFLSPTYRPCMWRERRRPLKSGHKDICTTNKIPDMISSSPTQIILKCLRSKSDTDGHSVREGSQEEDYFNWSPLLDSENIDAVSDPPSPPHSTLQATKWSTQALDLTLTKIALK